MSSAEDSSASDSSSSNDSSSSSTSPKPSAKDLTVTRSMPPNSSSSSSGRKTETAFQLGIQTLQGSWKHSLGLGTILVKGFTVTLKTGKVYKIEETNDGDLIMKGWVAVAQLSKPSRIEWQKVGDASARCSWSLPEESNGVSKLARAKELTKSAKNTKTVSPCSMEDLQGCWLHSLGLGLLTVRGEHVTFETGKTGPFAVTRQGERLVMKGWVAVSLLSSPKRIEWQRASDTSVGCIWTFRSELGKEASEPAKHDHGRVSKQGKNNEEVATPKKRRRMTDKTKTELDPEHDGGVTKKTLHADTRVSPQL